MPDRLAPYRGKRNFSRTTEPRGDVPADSASFPRFVVHKHDATNLHYDLRLEVDGVLKSWAVARGPSLDPTVKRLAVEVEDHPLGYGDFEGTIPKGEYGGGTVLIWDRGYWSPQGDKPLSRMLADGELKFTTGGSKLRGSWVLVRMKPGKRSSAHNNWLLIKHKDEWAVAGSGDQILRKERSVGSGRTMKQISSGTGPSATRFMVDDGRKTQTRARPAPTDNRGGVVATAPDDDGTSVLGVVISRPSKLLWPPADGRAVSKLELAHYLATVGPWMIDHIRGRPCSIVRAPDGIDGTHFFQRHYSQARSRHIRLVDIAGDKEPYLRIDTIAALVEMGQIAALEFHPGNCAPDRPEVPGRLVFDIDPAPDVPFVNVIAAAKELKERLEMVGLGAFCKTTGGKGLHVVAPLKPATSSHWDEAKTFAHAICLQMSEDNPSKYLVNMSKKKRVGRIFLDYLRNDRTATAVAVLSPRARPGAPVSMPLSWSQVKAGLDPGRFTIRTAPSLLSRSSAWSGYHAAARPLAAAIAKLVGGRR